MKIDVFGDIILLRFLQRGTELLHLHVPVQGHFPDLWSHSFQTAWYLCCNRSSVSFCRWASRFLGHNTRWRWLLVPSLHLALFYNLALYLSSKQWWTCRREQEGRGFSSFLLCTDILWLKLFLNCLGQARAEVLLVLFLGSNCWSAVCAAYLEPGLGCVGLPRLVLAPPPPCAMTSLRVEFRQALMVFFCLVHRVWRISNVKFSVQKHAGCGPATTMFRASLFCWIPTQTSAEGSFPWHTPCLAFSKNSESFEDT